MAKEKEYRIFLVDDDSKHLLLLEEHLKKNLPYKLNITRITNGEETLRRLNEKPDAIVLDYYFDGSGEDDETADGVEILKKLRRVKPDIPVVMMSHQDKVEVAVTCYEYGVKDYIVKNETSYIRAQLVLRNIILEDLKQQKAEQFRKGARIANFIMGAFIIILISLIVLMSNDMI